MKVIGNVSMRSPALSTSVSSSHALPPEILRPRMHHPQIAVVQNGEERVYDAGVDETGLFFIPLLAKGVAAAAKAAHKASRARKTTQRKAKAAAHKAKAAAHKVSRPSGSPIETQEAAKQAEATRIEAERLKAEVERLRQAEAAAHAEVERVHAEAKRKAEALALARRMAHPRSMREKAEFERMRRSQTPQDRAAALWFSTASPETIEKGRQENIEHLAWLRKMGLSGVREEEDAAVVDVGALFVDTDGYRHQHGPGTD